MTDSNSLRLRPLVRTPSGYGALALDAATLRGDVTTEDYAAAQESSQPGIARDYILPIIREARVRRVLDVGCGIGAMVDEIAEAGFESYGVDLLGLDRRWRELGRSPDRFFIVDPADFALPFDDGSFDFAFSIGAIEHVGTSDGHADRLPDWHDVRRQWTREIFRTLAVGGRMFLCGPNRNFPIDVAHGLDSRAASWERALSERLRMSVHRTWGDYFLWSHRDIARYLDGLPYRMEARSVHGMLAFSRAPAPLRALARRYVQHLPRPLLATGFNPWVMALITRTG